MRILSLLAIAALSFQGLALKAADIRMIGSTTTYLQVIQKYQDGICTKYNCKINSAANNSTKGMQALMAGQVEMALSADSLENLAKEMAAKGIQVNVADYEEVFLQNAYLVCIVNKDNPVTPLSTDQVRSLLAGEIKTWKEVGGENKPIALVQENPNSANVGLIQRDLMKDKTPTKGGIQVDNVRKVVANVSEIETAFGITPEIYLNSSVRIVSEAKIAQHLCLILRKDASPELKEIAQAFATSAKAGTK